jgi:3-oxoacyl-[acyl-carrier protein] reductase
MSAPSGRPVVVVTGAARGIGRSIALRLARAGLDVVITDERADALSACALEVRALGVQCLTLVGDVSDFALVQLQAAQVLERWGRIDVLVNNAGVSAPKPLLEISEAEWDRSLAINLKGYFNWCKAVAQHMVDRRGGRIVNISSVNAQTGAGPNAVSKVAYVVAKSGALGLTRALARELAPHVIVNAICPGAIETDLTRERFAPRRETIERGIPLARLGTPEDIAEVVCFLATASPMFMTGEVLDVDGGQWIN